MSLLGAEIRVAAAIYSTPCQGAGLGGLVIDIYLLWFYGFTKNGQRPVALNAEGIKQQEPASLASANTRFRSALAGFPQGPAMHTPPRLLLGFRHPLCSCLFSVSLCSASPSSPPQESFQKNRGQGAGGSCVSIQNIRCNYIISCNNWGNGEEVEQLGKVWEEASQGYGDNCPIANDPPESPSIYNTHWNHPTPT